MPEVPEIRVRAVNRRPVRMNGHYVLFWMTAARRVRWHFGLQRAAEWARRLDRPLVILEALRCDYPWASERLHAFILDGMSDNQRALSKKNVLYHPYVEPARGAGRTFTTAHSFRRFLQKNLRPHLERFPFPDPLAGGKLRRPKSLPAVVTRRWPARIPAKEELRDLPLDRQVLPTALAGGHRSAQKRLNGFLEKQLTGYSENRNHPDLDQTSRLSPWLHFGHISAHQETRGRR